jgi:hypothetical protein
MLDYGPDAILMKGLDAPTGVSRTTRRARLSGASKNNRIEDQAGRHHCRPEEIALRAAAAPGSRPPQVVVHAEELPRAEVRGVQLDEGEPGTCKDRDLLRYNPHACIEGWSSPATRWAASAGYNYIHGEIWEVYEQFEEALREGTPPAIWAEHLGSDFSYE